MAFVAENLNYIKCVQRQNIELTGAGDSNERGNTTTATDNSIGPSQSKDGINDDGSNESSEYTVANYPGVLESDLTALTQTERVVFIVTVVTLFVLSMCGNIGTLHVNFRRKIRPFFRACLISLAFSDLLNTCFLTVAYLGQFSSDFVQVWLLGQLLCNLVPFVTTAAILASSMTLVGIALDRYFAVTKAIISFWNPGVTFCVSCMFGIWAASIAISYPVYHVYDLYAVYILEEESTTMTGAMHSANDEAGTMTTTQTSWEEKASQENLSYTLVKELELVQMCVSNQRQLAVYYIIVFGIIFVPCIIAFVWLNTVIAKKLWIRRHTNTRHKDSVHHKKSSRKNKNSSTKRNEARRSQRRHSAPVSPDPNPSSAQNHAQPTTMRSSTAAPSSIVATIGGAVLQLPLQQPPARNVDGDATQQHPQKHHQQHQHPHPQEQQQQANGSRSSREARHLRMFIIIVLLIAVFLFLRLPAWIFLIMRMYGSYSRPWHWIVFFSFGILNLASCALNPLFYTFLAETIQCAIFFKVKIFDDFCGLRLCCERYQQRRVEVTACPAANYGGCDSNEVVTESPKSQRFCEQHCVIWRGFNGILKRLRCQSQMASENDPPVPLPQWRLSLVPEKIEEALGNNDMDEGVDCSDLSDESDVDDCTEFYEYTQRIYTIFPASLVSSSMTSE